MTANAKYGMLWVQRSAHFLRKEEVPNGPIHQQNPNRQGNYQQPYQPPYQPAPPAYDPTTQVMSIGQYVGMFILSALPVVNLICWIVWLCSPNTNKNKKNFIWANIIMWVISVVAVSLFYAFVGTAAFSALSSL